MRNIYHFRLSLNYLPRLFTALLLLAILSFETVGGYSQTSLITNVTATTGRTYTLSTLVTGTTIYSDRTYQATSVPSFLNNAPFIKTPNDDKTSTSTSVVSFNLSQNATVYVAYDPRATALPAWLSGWQKLGSQVGINDPKVSGLDLYSKTFTAGKVTLGGNLASPAAGALDNYFIAALAQPAQFKLTVTINGSGTVAKTPNQSTYAAGTSVSLKATPASGNQFTGWSGSATGTTNPITIVMNADKSVTATFKASTGTPSISANPSRIYDNTVSGTSGIKRTITIKNTGQGALTVSAINTTGTNTNQFAVSGLPTFPAKVNAGSSISFSVAFNPTSTGLKTATLNIKSNDPSHPSSSIPLRGLGTAGLGGAKEPSLQSVLNLLEIQASVGDDDVATDVINSSTTKQKAAILGDEISVQKFQRASSGNVTITPFAVFGPTFVNPVLRFGWYKSGNTSSLAELFTVSNSPVTNAQTVNVNFTGTLSFNPGSGAFGFYTRWPYFSDRHVYSEDNLNTFTGAAPHHVRVYPYKKNGVVMANSFLVAFEEDIKNLDYQDLVFLVTNVKKASMSLTASRTSEQVSLNGSDEPVYNSDKPGIYPNPVSNKGFTIRFPLNYQGVYKLQLVDIAGRRYDLGKTKVNAGGADMKADISGLSLKAGVYFLKIISAANKEEVIKLLIN